MPFTRVSTIENDLNFGTAIELTIRLSLKHCLQMVCNKKHYDPILNKKMIQVVYTVYVKMYHLSDFFLKQRKTLKMNYIRQVSKPTNIY